MYQGHGSINADADLAEVMACEDCIVSFRNQGRFSGKLQVKGLVEIQIK